MLNVDSDSAGPGWGQGWGICISDRLPGDPCGSLCSGSVWRSSGSWEVGLQLVPGKHPFTSCVQAWTLRLHHPIRAPLRALRLHRHIWVRACALRQHCRIRRPLRALRLHRCIRIPPWTLRQHCHTRRPLQALSLHRRIRVTLWTLRQRCRIPGPGVDPASQRRTLLPVWTLRRSLAAPRSCRGPCVSAAAPRTLRTAALQAVDPAPALPQPASECGRRAPHGWTAASRAGI